MIKANELRVGNLLEYYIPTDNLGWLVETIDWQDIRECQEQNESFNSNNRGIKLNEQWLINFGFKKNQSDIRYWMFSSLKIKISEKGFKFKYTTSIVYLKHVHELQNLYFALTKQELTLKKRLK